MSQNQTLNPTAPAADTPQPATKLTPEAIIEQIREFSARLINALIDRPDVRLGHR